MRFVISLLTAVCFITTAEATPQCQAAPSAPKVNIFDQIKHPSLKLAGNCQNTCQCCVPTR